MKKKYDLIFPLGTACSCSQCLRAAELQLLSFPYDWTAPMVSHDLCVRADHIANGFANWFEKGDLKCVPTMGTAIRAATDSHGRVRSFYRNLRTRHAFPHEFWVGESFDEAYPAAAEKYRRRIARFYECVGHSKKVLIVRIDTPIQNEPTSLKDCQQALETLSRRFPGTRFEILVLHCEKGVPFEDRRESSLNGNITSASWDYRDLTPGQPPYAVLTQQIGHWLKERYCVRDYRTRDEKAARRRRAQLAKYHANGAETYWQYRLINLRRKIARLLIRLGFQTTIQV